MMVLMTGLCFAGTAKDYRIGIVTPTLSASEDEFRGAIRVAKKYPGMIKHISLPENYQEEQETAITQILSLGDQKDIKAIVIAAGYSGILPAIQKLKAKRPDMIVITAPIWDDPDMMVKYVDLCLDTDWVRRGITIPEKAKKMGAKTFIHYSFPTHMAKEVLEVAMAMVEGRLKDITIENLCPMAKKVAGVNVYFEKMKPELNNYYLIVMDSIFY